MEKEYVSEITDCVGVKNVEVDRGTEKSAITDIRRHKNVYKF